MIRSITKSVYLPLVITISAITMLAVMADRETDPYTRQKLPSIPFDIKEEKRMEGGGDTIWNVSIVMPKEYFSKETLDQLFCSFSKKYPNREEKLHIKVYTSLNNWQQEHEVEFPDDFGLPATILPRDPASHRVLYDAVFYRQGNGAMASGGDNEWYIYKPDLDNPDKTQVVILKGTLRSRPKKSIESWETEHGVLKIRVIAYELPDASPKGIYYTFQYSKGEETSWFDIMTVRKNDLVSIRAEQMQFVNEDVVFVFMDWMYGGTTDGGSTWFIWDTERGLLTQECRENWMISEVHISADGNGIMKIRSTSGQGTVQELYTKDYGRHWEKN
jgi:hypothetical protein